LNGLDAIGLRVCKCCVSSIPGRVLQIWNWKANANCPQILPYTQEIRGKNRSRQWSGQKLYKNLFAPICAEVPSRTPRGSLQRSPYWWGGGAVPPHQSGTVWGSLQRSPRSTAGGEGRSPSPPPSGELTALPRPPTGGEGRSPSPRTPPRHGTLGFGTSCALPWKICCGITIIIIVIIMSK